MHVNSKNLEWEITIELSTYLNKKIHKNNTTLSRMQFNTITSESKKFHSATENNGSKWFQNRTIRQNCPTQQTKHHLCSESRSQSSSWTRQVRQQKSRWKQRNVT